MMANCRNRIGIGRIESICRHGRPLHVQVRTNIDLFYTDLGTRNNIADSVVPPNRKMEWFLDHNPRTAAFEAFSDMSLTILVEGPSIRRYYPSPHMFSSPVPAFPAVRASLLKGTASQEFEQFILAAVGGMHDFRLTMPVPLRQNRVRTVFGDDSFDLAGDDVCSFIPRDSFKLAFTPVLWVSLVRVPVYPL
jgi:hypothetical protein